MNRNIEQAISNFSLPTKYQKEYQYTSIQKKIIIDTIEFLEAGGDPYDGDPAQVFGKHLKAKDILDIAMYVHDSQSTSEFGKIVQNAIKSYGKICMLPLYRGISKAQADRIKVQMLKANSFSTYNAQSFSIDKAVAKKFAKNSGKILIVNCSKPIFHIDEFLYFYEVGCDLFNNDYKCTTANQQDFDEHEYLIPPTYKYNVTDKYNFTFEI